MQTYQQILVAVDFNQSIAKVIERAQLIAGNGNSKLSLIHVVEPAPVDFLDQTMLVDMNLDRLLFKTASQQMQKLATNHQIDSSDCYLEAGSVKSEIFSKIEMLDADLLVVGSHGRHGFGLLLGSTANSVLHGASCDVLAVRVNE
ncbi:MAG: universal stress protein [Gammaproteobacteria bacterium]|nr:universal stress protein [Gammaproteobacteria bacterium]